MHFSASAPITSSTTDGYVATLVARWREAAGELQWDTEPDGRVRLTSNDESEVLPVLLRRGTAGRPGSEYTLADSTFTTGEISGTLGGHPGALTGQAELAYEARSRGRADLDVHAHPPYSLTTTSTIPELRWEASANDGVEPTAAGDVRLRWAALTGALTVSSGHLHLEVDLGGRGLWKPVFGLGLLILRAQVQSALDRGLADLARDLDRMLTEAPTEDRSEQTHGDPTDSDSGSIESLPDLSLLNDLRFLRSPFSMMRKGRALAKQPTA